VDRASGIGLVPRVLFCYITRRIIILPFLNVGVHAMRMKSFVVVAFFGLAMFAEGQAPVVNLEQLKSQLGVDVPGPKVLTKLKVAVLASGFPQLVPEHSERTYEKQFSASGLSPTDFAKKINQEANAHFQKMNQAQAMLPKATKVIEVHAPAASTVSNVFAPVASLRKETGTVRWLRTVWSVLGKPEFESFHVININGMQNFQTGYVFAVDKLKVDVLLVSADLKGAPDGRGYFSRVFEKALQDGTLIVFHTGPAKNLGGGNIEILDHSFKGIFPPADNPNVITVGDEQPKKPELRIQSEHGAAMAAIMAVILKAQMPSANAEDLRRAISDQGKKPSSK